MKKTQTLLLLGSVIVMALPTAANAMLCRECSERQCQMLADKYSHGHYQMKSDGCNYYKEKDDENLDSSIEVDPNGVPIFNTPPPIKGGASNTGIKAIDAPSAPMLNGGGSRKVNMQNLTLK